MGFMEGFFAPLLGAVLYNATLLIAMFSISIGVAAGFYTLAWVVSLFRRRH